MKGENHDINIVEWENIPKFSKLDDIATLLRLLKLCFDDENMLLFSGYHKLKHHKMYWETTPNTFV